MASIKRGDYQTVTLPNNTASAISAGDWVEDDGSNGIKALTDGGNLLGCAHEDIAASGGVGEVDIPSPTSVWEVDLATGFNPNYLDDIYPAGSNTFDGGSQNNPKAGYIVDTNPASGSNKARAIILCQKNGPPLHA